jgi:uncharacterized protein YigA (DUF484 family)
MSDITQEQVEREALVAEWLKATPGFFDRHADLLAEVQLKSPHGDRAISLQEKQLGVLRAQNQALNQRLSEMLKFGTQNDKTQGLMIEWLKGLLGAGDEDAVKAALVQGLAGVFAIESVKIVVLDDVHNYCGSKDSAPEPLKSMLSETAQSVAVIELASAGLRLILESVSLDKFTSDMGRVYLNQIGELATAALMRARG